MSQPRPPANTLPFASVELAGIAYAILPAAQLAAVCRKAGLVAIPLGFAPLSPLDLAAPDTLDAAGLAQRLAERRQRAGLTQADLARRAGVRIETVNRIERGRVTPDFGTIRKLVQAMLDVEGAPRPRRPIPRSSKE